MRGSVNTSTNYKETIISNKNKKVKRRPVEKPDHTMSMEQINIITPNAPQYDTKNMARNSSIQSLNGPGRSVNASALRSVSQNTTIIKTPKGRDLLPINMFNPDTDYFRQIE